MYVEVFLVASGRSGFDKIISNRARLRLVACVVVHKAAKDADYVPTDANSPYGKQFYQIRSCELIKVKEYIIRR